MALLQPRGELERGVIKAGPSLLGADAGERSRTLAARRGSPNEALILGASRGVDRVGEPLELRRRD